MDNVNWVEVPGMNIKSDRDAQAGESICAFVVDKSTENIKQIISFNPIGDETNHYTWPEIFSDKINQQGVQIRAGEKNSSGGFDTVASQYRNKLWRPEGADLTVFSTNCSLDSWSDNGEINAISDLPVGLNLVVETKSKRHGVVYERLVFPVTREVSGRYTWPYSLSHYVNTHSLYVRCGEKNNDSKLIVPLVSSYRNHFWSPVGADISVSMQYQVSSLSGDAEKTYQNALTAIQSSPPSKETVDTWLKNFKGGLFADITYPAQQAGSNTAPLYTHLNRVKSIAGFVRSIPVEQAQYYLSCAVAALNLYASKNYQTSNWWDRQVGLAKVAAESVVLLADKSLSGQLLPSLHYLKKTTNTTMNQTGANLADFAYIQFCWAIGGWQHVSEAGYLVDGFAASEAISSLCLPVSRHGVESGEGISKDYSFSQHNPGKGGKYSQIYAGGYGLALLRSIFKLQPVLVGALALNGRSIQSLERFLLDGMGWFSYAQQFDFQVDGRGISRGMRYSNELAQWSGQLLKENPVNPLALQELMQRANGNEANNRYFAGNRAFWVNDYMTHITKEFCLWSKMVSTRTVGTETGNGENLKGYYMGAGSYFLTRNGQEYRDIQPLWEWQRIPGTTVEQDPSFKYPLVEWGYNAWGSHDFAGAVSDERVGVSSMILSKQNVKNAKKTVVALDDGAIFMGSSIDTSTAKYPVCTSINQSTLRGDVVIRYSTGEQQSLSLGDRVTSSAITDVTHDGFRYSFPQTAQAITVDASVRSGSWHDINVGGSKERVSGNVFSI